VLRSVYVLNIHVRVNVQEQSAAGTVVRGCFREDSSTKIDLGKQSSEFVYEIETRLPRRKALESRDMLRRRFI
jgi:hypothetical protein